MKKTLAVNLILLCMFAGCGKHQAQPSSPSLPAAAEVIGPFSAQELEEFTSLGPIDTHTHVYQSDPVFFTMLKRLHLHILDIVVVGSNHSTGWKTLSGESAAAWKVVKASDGYASFCTTFDPYGFSNRGFAAEAIRQINESFAQGAIAVKIWKNIGMEIKDAKGSYVLPDDPIFEPIYKDIAAHNKTLMAHLADPDSSWQAPNPASPDYSYFVENPEWYMYNKPHHASKEDILRARDHLLELNPNLRVVGAHLGSMEANFAQLGQHFDRYPNFAVDFGGRLSYFMLQPREDMIRFITRYQDRLLYSTDISFRPQDDGQKKVTELEKIYAEDWRYLATNDTVVDLDSGHKAQGLGLPPSILRKLYHDNAVRWFPGIASNSE